MGSWIQNYREIIAHKTITLNISEENFANFDNFFYNKKLYSPK